MTPVFLGHLRVKNNLNLRLMFDRYDEKSLTETPEQDETEEWV